MRNFQQDPLGSFFVLWHFRNNMKFYQCHIYIKKLDWIKKDLLTIQRNQKHKKFGCWQHLNEDEVTFWRWLYNFLGPTSIHMCNSKSKFILEQLAHLANVKIWNLSFEWFFCYWVQHICCGFGSLEWITRSKKASGIFRNGSVWVNDDLYLYIYPVCFYLRKKNTTKTQSAFKIRSQTILLFL